MTRFVSAIMGKGGQVEAITHAIHYKSDSEKWNECNIAVFRVSFLEIN